MRLSTLRFVTNVLDQVLPKFRSEAPKYLKTNKEIVYKKIADLNNWYTRILGLDEVKQYQDRVVTLQEKLLAAQEQRRDIGRQLAEVRKISNRLQDEIHKVKRQENLERFFNLMKEETEVLRRENEISSMFQECDQTERELFTAFTNAVRDSHEKQRAQLEYTKYFGIILSIAGSFLAFFYSTLRKHDLKVFIDERLSQELSAKTDSNSGVQLIRDEVGKLAKLITDNNNRSSGTSGEDSTRQQLMYCVGAGVLLCIVLKIVSSSN